MAGTLLACLLTQRGWHVSLYERRPDPRIHGCAAGRSINLALAERGLHALRQAKLDTVVMPHAIAMRGRMIHTLDRPPAFHPYGKEASEVIWSIHRGRLNLCLVEAAARAGAKLHFNCPVNALDLEHSRLVTADGATHSFDLLVGADGADSCVRSELARHHDLGIEREILAHSYKELEIPPASDGGFRLESNALHIWPRGGHMCIALPNVQGSFTSTLFLATHAAPDTYASFENLSNGQTARAWFDKEFPDLSKNLPALESEFEAHPTGTLGTLRLKRWHLDNKVVLIGDAAHPMVPFHGQGMNCALEDAVALADCLQRQPTDQHAALQAFATERQPNALAIQAMALENYVEMRQRVATPDYELERELSAWLAQRHPYHFVPRYSMVTFSRLPYALAFERGQIQAGILRESVAGCNSFKQIDLIGAQRKLIERLGRIPSHDHIS
ncbi:NAD(P)/FAD-dependent oxidoreductase [Pseudomonas chlororaphis]|uniref:FAD-dependent oxidoreductase n=1 Tax=Pseudomonas chlororaphis TaxID=587753 RepID=UPI0030D0CC24